MKPVKKTVKVMRPSYLVGWESWSKGWEPSDMGTTFTTKQKLGAYFAFKRGWREAMKDARRRPDSRREGPVVTNQGERRNF